MRSPSPFLSSAQTQTIQTRTLADVVADRVATEIVSGVIKPGEALGEAEVAARLGVSRSPVREAIRRLAAEGLVQIVPRRGAVVTSLSEADGTNLYEVRALLEGLCVRHVVEEGSADATKALDALFRQMEVAARTEDAATYYELNARFHLTLYGLCPNVTIRDLIAQLWRKTMRYRMILADNRGRVQRSLRAHKELMQAIKAGDGAGAEEIVRRMTREAGVELARLLRDREQSLAQSRTEA